MRAAISCSLFLLLVLRPAPAQQSVIHEWLGEHNGDQFGYAVDGAGDVNNDGVPDIIIGSNRDDTTAGDAGRVSVYSGADGTRLYFWDGSGANAQMGAAVAGVGDINQDNHDDFLYSELHPFTSTPGTAILRSGKDGTILHQWSGGGSDYFGFALAGIGDITGDTIPDVAVAASVETGTNWQGGKVYIYNGASGAVIRSYEGAVWNAQMGTWIGGGKDLSGDGVPDYSISTVNQDMVQVFSGATGAELYDIVSAGGFGSHVEFSDDVDGDNMADFIIGDFSSPGNAYLYSGVDGTRLWRKTGTNSFDAYGWGVAALGDTNGDDIPDFAVGAYGVDNVDSASGVAQVLSGIDGSVLVEYNGNAYSAFLGWQVAGPGDIDGDGLGDLVAAAVPPFHAPVFPGYVRVYSGGCLGSAQEYGNGHAGSGGFVPHLSAQGCPAVSGSFGITLDGALGNAGGFLLIGFASTNLPLFGGELLVLPPWIMMPISTPGIGAGGGVMSNNTVLDDDPNLIDLQFYMQALLNDGGASAGYSLSNGLSVLIR